MNKFWLLLVSVVFFSCQQEIKNDYALFSGKVTGSAKEIRIFGNDFEHRVPIIEDGTFSDTLKIAAEGYYDFNIGKERSAIYLTKGSDINLTIDTQKFDESIVYTGTGSIENNFLAQKFLKIEEIYKNPKGFYSLEPEEFKKKSTEIKNSILQLLQSNKETSPDFIKAETLDNMYGHLGRLYDYKGAHKFYTKKKDLVIPDNFFEDTKGVDLLDEQAYISFPNYKNLAKGHLFRNLNELEEKYDGDQTKAFGELVSKLSANSKLKEDFLYSMSYSMSSSKNLEGFYAILKTTPNKDHQIAYEKSYNTFKNLVRGKPSPVFDYENYKGGSTALADLKGKYVYLDIWATWCGPCKREIPFLKQIEKEYHGKNINFVSISIDQKKDYDAWRKMIEEKDLGGIQLIADKNWSSDFITKYGIRGIPRFILVDPDGNIINADAPRPSNPELKKLFEELKIV